MNTEHEEHLLSIKEKFCREVDAKYRKGQAEHGGQLWEKRGLIENAIEEAIDQAVYLYTLKEQIDKSGVILGTRVDNIPQSKPKENSPLVNQKTGEIYKSL